MADKETEQNTSKADRGLSDIRGSGPKVGDALWYIGGFILVLGILWLNFGGVLKGSDKDQAITQKQDEQYRIVTSYKDPAVPESTLKSPAPSASQDTLDPMLLEHQLRMAELERKKEQAAQKLAEARRRSPMLVYSKTAPERGGHLSEAQIFETDPGNFATLSQSGNTAQDGFYDGNQRSHVETVRASRLQNQDHMIAQGTTIRGVLETAVHSDLAGYIRAIVSEDIYSFDGTQILVPRGSKIIGRYQSGIKQSQARLFVVWQRIIRPDGVDIMVDSPGTDYLGRAGLGGDIDTHFMERFGSAILLSLIDGAIQAGVNAANDDTADTVVTGSGGGLNRSAEIALENSINIRPTIHVNQGTPINIFVTKDLDFSSVKPPKKGFAWWR
jgi:type IV secretion system protein VirB10